MNLPPPPPPPPPSQPPRDPEDLGDRFAVIFSSEPEPLENPFDLDEMKAWVKKNQWAVVVGCVVLLGLINPRVRVNENGAIAMSCTTKTMLISGIKMDNGYNVGPGIYSPDGLTKSMLKSARRSYMRETAGNPFQAIGFGMMSAMEEPMKDMVETVIDDVCEG